ncbi:MAG: hypothetical protein ACKOGA_21160, partial [Planctomycetaceae bacterium]
MAGLPVPAVFPVLPVVTGWLLALAGGLGSLVLATLTLRRGGWRTLGRVLWRLAPGLVVALLIVGGGIVLGKWGFRRRPAEVVGPAADAAPWTLAAGGGPAEWPELRG